MTRLPRTLDGLLRVAALGTLCAFAATASAAEPAKSVKAAPAKSAKAAPAKPVEAPLAEANTEQIDAAERVYYGVYDCEFNQTVDIEKHPKHAAYVNVKTGKSAWLMKPVLSSTGAIRLEDTKGETLMVQISSKSMLLNVKTARRIVDDCISPKQRELIAAAKAAKEAEAAKAADPAAKAPVDAAAAAAAAAASSNSMPAASSSVAANGAATDPASAPK
ncbi:MAG: hypothetical protein ABIS28_03420 [Caldimonas sp.]